MCSNIEVDRAIITQFYDSALEFVQGQSDAHEVMLLLAKEFPDDPRGNALTQEIFGCSVSELHHDPFRHTTRYTVVHSGISHSVSSALLIESEQLDLNRQTQQELRSRLSVGRAVYVEQQGCLARQGEEKEDQPPAPSGS